MSFSRTCVALFAASLLLIAFSAFSSRCEVGRPAIAIDFEIAPTPDISVIDSVYSGYAEYLYAFLVIDEVPGGNVSAYDLGFEVVSPDSSIVNMGFSRLPGWVGLEASGDDFPEPTSLVSQQTPVVVGYWKIALKNGRSSSGKFLLVPNPRNSSLAIRIVDGEGNSVSPGRISNGSINPQAAPPADSLPTTWEFVRRDCLGRPIPENREAPHVPGEVVARFQLGVINLPDDRESGSISDIEASRVVRVASHFGLTELKRACRNATEGERQVISRTGNLVTLPDRRHVYRLKFASDTSVWTVVDSLRAIIPECVYAQPNFVSYARLAPNDTWYNDVKQWNLFRMNLEEAWDDQIGSMDVRIGILDSGIDYNHPDLGGGIGPGFKVGGGYDYVNDDWDPMDDNTRTSHGTAVAGLAAALTNNDEGIAGIAGGWGPGNLGCILYALKTQNSEGEGQSLDQIPAILDAWPVFGIDVINASWGKYENNYLLGSAIAASYKMGVVFVAAKGNEDTNERSWPCDYNDNWVISVGETTCPPWVEHRNYTAYGWDIDMLAPGGEVFSTEVTSTGTLYGKFGGTSGATAQVTGLAALILSTAESETLAVEDIEGIIEASCDDITYDPADPDSVLIGYDDYSGWGRPNADKIMDILTAPCWELLHLTSTEGYVVHETDYCTILFLGAGLPASGYWPAKRYDMRCDVTFPSAFVVGPHVWGRGHGATIGWSGENPNYMVNWCRVVPGTVTQSGCQLQTFVYYVRDWNGEPAGWFPCTPSEAVFAYSALGG